MVFSCPWAPALAVLGFLWACYSVCNPLYASNLRWYFGLVWFPFVWITRPGLPAVCPSALSLSFVHLRLIWPAESAPFRMRSSPVCLLLCPSPTYPWSISSGTLLSPERSYLEYSCARPWWRRTPRSASCRLGGSLHRRLLGQHWSIALWTCAILPLCASPQLRISCRLDAASWRRGHSESRHIVELGPSECWNARLLSEELQNQDQPLEKLDQPWS